MRADSRAPIAQVTAAACRMPTDAPESDGTFARDATTLVLVLVLVRVQAGGREGIGYSYAAPAAAALVKRASHRCPRARTRR